MPCGDIFLTAVTTLVPRFTTSRCNMFLSFTKQYSLYCRSRKPWSKAWVYGFSLAGIVGSNPAGGLNVCLLWILFVVRGLCFGPITSPEQSHRLWCVCVWSWKLTEEAQVQ